MINETESRFEGVGKQAAKGMKIDLMKPGKICCACGEDVSDHDEKYVVAVGKTMCARCFFEGLTIGKGAKE